MATMKDIARLAGVSTSTVSHVINKSRFVSDEIAERVNNAAQQLNYAPPLSRVASNEPHQNHWHVSDHLDQPIFW